MGRKSKPVTGFDPSAIATRLAEAIRRDLSSVNHETTVDPDAVRYTEVVYEKTLLKKFNWGCPEETLREDAFTAFRLRMSHMRRSNDFLVALRNRPSMDPGLYSALNRARVLSSHILGSLNIEEVYQNCKASTGVTFGLTFRDTTLEKKFSFPVSTTKRLIPLFREYLQWDSNLAEALFWANQDKPDIFDVTECSRATTVPKTRDQVRMIAIEPTLNMFFQQGLMAVMYSRLKSFDLDVTSLPQHHKALAWQGSISGEIATIDFSSASDCVTTELAKWILPPDWYALIDVIRAPSIKLNSQTMELPIVSTMGNATTFPIETLIFYCLAVASCMVYDEPYQGEYLYNPNRLLSTPEERASCSVFGDDCLLPTRSAELFMSLCTRVGFIVNAEKSFFDKDLQFRESCGGDYYRGRDVRGLYITSPTTDRVSALAPWLYTLLNSIRTKYIKYFGALHWMYDREALRLIFDLFREYKLLIRIVPRYMPDDSGLHHEDIDRLIRHYHFHMAATFSHRSSGVAKFSYCRFNYRVKGKLDYNIRYWNELRRLSGLSCEDESIDDTHVHGYANIRKQVTVRLKAKGGYFVAPGYTTIW